MRYIAKPTRALNSLYYTTTVIDCIQYIKTDISTHLCILSKFPLIHYHGDDQKILLLCNTVTRKCLFFSQIIFEITFLTYGIRSEG